MINDLDEIKHSWYCSTCKKNLELTLTEEDNDGTNCPECHSDLHMVFPTTNPEYAPMILVKEENFKSVLPEKLWYYFNMYKSQKKPTISTFIIEYSISQNAISVDCGKTWIKAK